MKKFLWLTLALIIVLTLLLTACAASGGGGGEPAVSAENTLPAAPAGGEEPGNQPEATQAEAAPAEVEPTSTPEISDVPIFEGAEAYKTTGDGSYISYVVPDTTVEIVAQFYQEQLVAAGWDLPTRKDSGFGGSITILRTKPEKRISITIDTNVANNGVRVLITTVDR